jgi:hypothetical protein
MPCGRTFVIGCGFFGISMIWPLFNSLIPPLLEDLSLPPIAVGFVLVWDDAIDMVPQPIISRRHRMITDRRLDDRPDRASFDLGHERHLNGACTACHNPYPGRAGLKVPGQCMKMRIEI